MSSASRAPLMVSELAVPDVSARLTPEQIDALLDPTGYTGVCSLFAEKGAAQARAVAANLR